MENIEDIVVEVVDDVDGGIATAKELIVVREISLILEKISPQALIYLFQL